MRVVVAPDSFGETLSAPEAAAAIAEGWRRTAPGDELELLPVADGGTGFVDVLYAVLGGTLHTTTVIGPSGAPVPATWLQVGECAYVESAAVCGLHLVPRAERTPQTAATVTTHGVGELIRAAIAAGATEIVVGLGGSATTDGGAGMLAALGAHPLAADGAELPPGGAALADVARLDGRPDIAGLRLVAAVDVDDPLLGRHGAAAVFGPQKGADDRMIAVLDESLARFADVLAEHTGRDVRDEPGAGAAGGLGAALLALGAERVSGAGLVRGLVGLDAALDRAGLVITGEGSFDWQSLRGKLVTAVARGAAERGVPCIVLAGQVSVGRREAAAVGVEAAYGVAEQTGLEASLADPAGTLASLAERVAKRWSR
ncbi:glycerate kinase [Pseudonocardia thermophila]|uniref:Glycerate kinase n=1 Tax=Pseudonocardia thermophila TaxID=1848 RepID=A0A1M6R2Q7_PSETH|nr:glycerate kinase [Pseudonocardia thermophila]SHK26713.1 glycerate kinase [Pseudonocardia thermophila]